MGQSASRHYSNTHDLTWASIIHILFICKIGFINLTIHAIDVCVFLVKTKNKWLCLIVLFFPKPSSSVELCI